MKGLPRRRGFSTPFVARLIVTATLACALLSGIIPFRAASSDNLCTMACCAGKAPHLAGSCHMGLSTAVTTEPNPTCEHGQSLHHHHDGVMSMDHAPPADDELLSPHTGLTELTESTPLGSGRDARPVRPRVTTRTMTMPCPSDCCAGAVGFAQGRRSRDQAAPWYASQPRPPTLSGLFSSLDQPAPLLSSARRPCRPRGPPSISS